VPLSQFARLKYEYEEPILWRRNRDTVLTVHGDIVDNAQGPDVTKEVLPNLEPTVEFLALLSSNGDATSNPEHRRKRHSDGISRGHAGRRT
jgi:multidrug efflux pump subunit AcrB